MLFLCNIIAFLLNLKHVCRLSSAAALVVILRVVATLVEGSAHERIRFHI